MPFFSRSRTAQLSRDGLWTTCPRSAPSGMEWHGHGMAGETHGRGMICGIGLKSTGYTLNSPVSPSLPFPCVTVCHHISTGLYLGRLLVEAFGRRPTRGAAANGIQPFHTTSMPTPCVTSRSSSSSDDNVEPSQRERRLSRIARRRPSVRLAFP